MLNVSVFPIDVAPPPRFPRALPPAGAYPPAQGSLFFLASVGADDRGPSSSLQVPLSLVLSGPDERTCFSTVGGPPRSDNASLPRFTLLSFPFLFSLGSPPRSFFFIWQGLSPAFPHGLGFWCHLFFFFFFFSFLLGQRCPFPLFFCPPRSRFSSFFPSAFFSVGWGPSRLFLTFLRRFFFFFFRRCTGILSPLSLLTYVTGLQGGFPPLPDSLSPFFRKLSPFFLFPQERLDIGGFSGLLRRSDLSPFSFFCKAGGIPLLFFSRPGRKGPSRGEPPPRRGTKDGVFFFPEGQLAHAGVEFPLSFSRASK